MRIANMCVMNYPKLENNGLAGGKMGAIVFLYEYSRRGGGDYSGEADLLVEQLLGELQSRQPSLTEVAQVGVAVDHLVGQGYLEFDGRPEEIFGDLIGPGAKDDPHVQDPANAPEGTRFWPGFYVLSLLRRSGPVMPVLSLAARSLDTLARIYGGGDPGPLSFANSALYFTDELRRRGVLAAKTADVAKLLSGHVSRYFADKEEHGRTEMGVLERLTARETADGGVPSVEGGANHVKRMCVRDDPWPDMIYPRPGRRPPFDMPELEAWVADKADNFKASGLSDLIGKGLYLLGVGINRAAEVPGRDKLKTTIPK